MDNKKKNKDNYVEAGRVMARSKVKRPLLVDHVKEVTKHKYLKERVKSVKVLVKKLKL